MARKFSQGEIHELTGKLRHLGKHGTLGNRSTMNRAADLIEEMAVVVYGIQERFPETYGRIIEDVETGDKL